MSDLVLLERGDDGVALVTLNRPDAMNALSRKLQAAICDVMASVRADQTVRALVITGAGERAFTAGLDLKELGAGASTLGAGSDADPSRDPISAIEHCGKPVIGAINGVAITGGFELALACTMRIASVNARFADTHALVGVIPGWGLSQKLSRIVGLGRAKEMSLSGRFIDAQTALAWGLVNRIVSADDLLPQARALAAQIARLDPTFLNRYERLIDEGYDMPFSTALKFERALSSAYNKSVTADSIEQRRKDVMARGRTQV